MAAERRGIQAYEQSRAHGRMKNGRRLGAPPKPYVPPDSAPGEVNTTDQDSQVMNAFRGLVQGYDVQTRQRSPDRFGGRITAEPSLRAAAPDDRRNRRELTQA